MQTIRKVSFILSVILTFLILFSRTVIAQQSALNLSLSPVFFEYTPKSREVIKDKIRLRNNSDKPVSLRVTISKMEADENGNLTLKDKTAADIFLDWIKIEKPNFTAPSKEWTDIPFTITIPDYAAYGYYIAVSVSEENKTKSGNQVAIAGSAVVPILINVRKEGARAEAKLLEFKSNNSLIEYLPVAFTTKIQNTGNIHIRPRGNIFIRGQGNKDLAIIDVNEDMGAILPSAIRSFEDSWSDGFIVEEQEMEDGEPKRDKDSNIVKKVTFNWDKLSHFRLGQYTADLFLVFDDGKKDVTIEGSTTFWVIPYKLISGIIIVIVVILVILRVILKKYVEKEIEKRTKQV